MNIKIVLAIFILLLFFNECLISQSFLSPLGVNSQINKDSIFEKYVDPEIPDELIKSYGDIKDSNCSSNFLILCFIEVDTTLKVKNMKMHPIYEFNDKNCKYWEPILKSLDSISKQWVFKPIYFQIKNEFSEESRKYYEEQNMKIKNNEYVKNKPFGGRQSHIVLIEIGMPWKDNNGPMFLYYLITN